MAMIALTTVEEHEFLRRCALSAPDEGWLVELGTFQGATCAVLCGAVGDERVMSIDDYRPMIQGQTSLELSQRNLAAIGYEPMLIQGKSYDVPESLEGVALLFIDSDHTRGVLYRELANWTPLLVNDAIVVMHDYGYPKSPEMRPAIDEYFADSDSDWEWVGHVGYMIAFRKVEQDEDWVDSRPGD